MRVNAQYLAHLRTFGIFKGKYARHTRPDVHSILTRLNEIQAEINTEFKEA